MKYIKIPKDFYKPLKYKVQFDWLAYYKLVLFNRIERLKKILNGK